MAKIETLLQISCLMTLFSCSGDMCHTYLNRYISPLEINSVVKNKYLDSNYKNIPTLAIEIDGKEKLISPFGHDTIFWSKVSIGDTLIKKEGSLDFMIISNGDTLYKSIDNCNIMN